ncbi:uncharacterized protein CBL_03116 [Carabus blaptoides fortunei]
MEAYNENIKVSVAPTINSEHSSNASSVRKQKINYKDELVFLFFNSMLEMIVDSWESEDIDEVESIPSGSTIIYSKPYTQVVQEDLENASILSVEGSHISLIKTQGETSDIRDSKFKKRLSKKQKNEKVRYSISRSVNLNDKKVKRQSNSLKKNSNDLTGSTVIDFSEHHKDSTSSTTSWFVEYTDGNVIIEFKNGNKYEGHVTRKLMDGHGIFTWKDGSKYIGEFCNGQITGNGSMHFSDMSYYTGDFYNGYRHGHGSMIMTESPQVYNGSWYCGQRNGDGWMLFDLGNWYEGEWKDGSMHGYGMRHYASGNIYYGEWENGIRHGQGVAIFENNDFYTGNWMKGKRNGYGEYTWKGFLNKTFSFPPENKYMGSWENNLMHGVGIMNFGMGGGAKYAGCYQNNLKHGPGLFICENGVSYEASPLFINDKVILTREPESDDNATTVTSLNIHKHGKERRKHTNTPTTSPNKNDIGHRNKSTLGLINKHIETGIPITTLDVNTLFSITSSKVKFPQTKNTIYIPINVPDHMINISFYIEKIVQKFHKTLLKVSSKELSFESSQNKFNSSVKCFDSPLIRKTFSNTDICSDKGELLNTSRSELMASEEKWLRKTITYHLPRLRSIYHRYSSISCPTILPFKVHMIRLFLWQLYRDCKIPDEGVSLTETDNLLTEHCETEIEKLHCPFELIYFWQFLHSLISVAYRLYIDDCVNFVHEGILKTAFNRFLEKNIFPNIGKHTGSVLFDYRDLLPLKNVYQWYQTFGEPHTVLSFIQNTCNIEKSGKVSCLTRNFEKIFGLNSKNIIAVGRNLVYLEEHFDDYDDAIPKSREAKKLSRESLCCKLSFLHTLNIKTIFKCIKTLLPHMVQHNEIVNINYPLIFLEFYELVLMCAQKVVDKEKRNAEEARVKEEIVHLLEESESIVEDVTDDKKRRRSKKNMIKKRKSEYT